MKTKLLFYLVTCIMCFSGSLYAKQVGIGTESPKPSSILDITSTNKGVLFPRVALKSRTDKATITNPEVGLMVYNTGDDAAFQIEGFLFWNGNEWRIFNSGQTISPIISTLSCGTAELVPSTYKAGEAYDGILRVPYTGGNGGSYGAGDATTTADGFTIQLQSGILERGSGFLTYSVTNSNPMISSPTTTNLPIDVPFNTNLNCIATVGTANANIQTRTYLGQMTLTSANDGAEFVVTTLDDRYQIRFFIKAGTSLTETDIQMRINPSASIINDKLIIMHQYTWTQITNGTANYGSSITYRDGSNTVKSMYIGNGTSAGQSWNDYEVTQTWKTQGDPAVYSQGAPEYRQLIFMSSELDQKRVYRYTLFFGAPSISYTAYPNTKCWVYAEEIQSE